MPIPQAATLRTRGFTEPADHLLGTDHGSISVELRVPGGDTADLGTHPRRRPDAPVARGRDPLSARGVGFGYRERAATGHHGRAASDR